MAVEFINIDRETPFLLPASVQDYIAEKHLARFITEIVSQLDLRGWCRKVGGKLEDRRKLLIVKHSERRSTAAERSLRHGTPYSIDVAHFIFR